MPMRRSPVPPPKLQHRRLTAPNKTVWLRPGAIDHLGAMQKSPRFRYLARALLFSAVLLSISSAQAQPRPVEIEDLFRLHRVSDPQISPDGKRVAYVVTDVVKEENRTNADLWL